jgi:hypothetical protein
MATPPVEKLGGDATDLVEHELTREGAKTP